ncbi:hypothetical protein GGI20_004283 [Coemansia sp. BCRC 34301]|nr:hypothetical protein GGI20_004283 [Coemansia sp. BCRC 34301]
MPVVETATQAVSAAAASAQVPSKDAPNLKGSCGDCVERELTWDEVKQILAADRVDLLGRTVEQQRVYAEYMEQLALEYGSVVAYIRQIKLAPFIADNSKEHLVLLNDFPYALTPDMAHFIVWSKQKLTTGMVPDPVILELFSAHLDELIGAGKYEWVWFVNPPHLQSIPEAAHGHLIVRTL